MGWRAREDRLKTGLPPLFSPLGGATAVQMHAHLSNREVLIATRTSQKQKSLHVAGFFISGAPERIRTSDLCLRRAALYPAELRALEARDCNTDRLIEYR